MDGAKATVEVKAPPKKLCSIKDVLPPSVIPLVAAAPNNDTIRNLLLAHLKVPVPKEEDTYEKVVKWIEFNVAKPPPPKSDVEIMLERQQRDEERRNANRVMIHVRASEREHGRCNYHHDRAGRGDMPIDRNRIVDAAAEADNADDFFDRIREYLDEANPGNYINMEETGEGDAYDDHESDDTTDQEITIQDAGKQVLKDTLRAADPELYRSLFG